MEPIDSPACAAAIQARVSTLDATLLADQANALTGGCLRPADATALLTLVALSAARSPGQAAQLGAFCAQRHGDRLDLWFTEAIAGFDLPAGEEGR